MTKAIALVALVLIAAPAVRAESKAETIQKLFDRGTAATTEQLIGAYAGRCFRTDGGPPTANPDEPFGMLYVAREIEGKPDANAGPLFPKPEKTIKANLWYEGERAKKGYEDFSEKKAIEAFKNNSLKSTNMTLGATEASFNNVYTQYYSDEYYQYETGKWNVAYRARWSENYLVVLGSDQGDKDQKVKIACYFYKKLQ